MASCTARTKDHGEPADESGYGLLAYKPHVVDIRAPAKPKGCVLKFYYCLRQTIGQMKLLPALLCWFGLLGVFNVSLAAQAGISAPPASTPLTARAAAADATCPVLLRHSFDRLQDEKPQSLCQYAGKVLLVVNTASYCGFTGQYAGLEDLYAKYKDKGLVVLGFPSNDFAQESGNNGQIADFCQNTYGVKFPMFSKSQVSGSAASPFYRELASAAGAAPSWNFYKYLVGRDGRVVDHFISTTAPDNGRLVQAVQRALAQATPKAAP